MTENPKLRVIFGLVDTLKDDHDSIPVSKKCLEEIRKYTQELESKIKNLGKRSEPPHPLLGDVTPLSVSCKTCRYDIYPHDIGECSGSLCMNYSSYEPANKVLTDEERDENYKKMHQQWLENATGKA